MLTRTEAQMRPLTDKTLHHLTPELRGRVVKSIIPLATPCLSIDKTACDLATNKKKDAYSHTLRHVTNIKFGGAGQEQGRTQLADVPTKAHKVVQGFVLQPEQLFTGTS